MPELKPIRTTRIVATKEALDQLSVPDGCLALRVAPDEMLVLPPTEVEVADAYAIVIEDSSFAGVWWDSAEMLAILERSCEWEIPTERPKFAQGMIAGIPAKLWLENDSILLICPLAYAAEMEQRIV